MKRKEMKSSEESKAKTIKKLIKRATVHAVSFGLLASPTVYAQQQGGLGGAVGSAIGIVQQGMQQMMQQRQAAMQQAQMQAMMSRLQPQKVPSKYFPQCAVSKAVTDFPEGACEGPVTGPQDLAQIDAFKSLATNYESFFENLTATNQNSPQPVGLQCIQESSKKTDAQLQDKINALTALINKVKKETQAFEQEHAKIKEQMDITKDLLYGPIRNADVRATNLLAEFSPTCQNYYKNGGKAAVTREGFTSLRDTAELHRNQAADFENNKSSYVSDLKNQLNSIRNEVGKTGIGIMSSQERLSNILAIGGNTFNFGSAGQIVSSSISKFQNDFEVIQRDLSDVGYNITIEDLDNEFNTRMTRFSKGAKEYFMKEAISDCVSGKGSTGIGLSTDQILNGLRHRSFNKGGPSTTLNSYKTALSNILNSDAFIEDKMAAIATLDKTYGVGEIFVQVAGADAQSRTVTAYGLYQEQIETCKARISQDDTFSTDAGLRANGSTAERIADAERAMKKAIALEQTFLDDLTNGIHERVVNCKGIEENKTRCDFTNGGAQNFATEDPQFCISHASSCAQEVKACYQEADIVVQKKQAEMKTLASTFNERVSGLVAQQEFFLNQIKAQVVNDAEFVKRFIPGSSYQFPEDLFVDMPEEVMNNEYGVALRGGGNIENLVNDLPKKLDSLKDMLNGQRTLVAKHLGDYLNEQRAGMEKDRTKWSQLKEKCLGAIAGYNEQVAQQNQANAEQQGKLAESDAMAGTFCQKYNDAATNPAAGCGKADDLAEEVYNVSGSLANSSDVRIAVQDFQHHCKQANNEREDDSSSDDSPSLSDRDFETLSNHCGSSTSDLYSYLSTEIEEQIPEGLDDTDRKLAIAIINGDQNGRDIASDFSSEFRKSSFYRNVLDPYDRMRNNVGNIQVTELPAAAEGTNSFITDKISQFNGRAGEVDACVAYELFKERNAISACSSNTEDPEKCYKNKINDYYSPNNSDLERMAQVTATVNDRVVASTSNRLGERMLDTPCIAQQGFNGSQGQQGGPTGSPLDVSGWDIINSAIGR